MQRRQNYTAVSLALVNNAMFLCERLQEERIKHSQSPVRARLHIHEVLEQFLLLKMLLGCFISVQMGCVVFFPPSVLLGQNYSSNYAFFFFFKPNSLLI